jgi:hypothetical protein
MKRRSLVPLAPLAIIFVLLARPAQAQDYSNIRIVRLSFVEGTVEFQRPGQDWQDAGLNLPIQEGFAIRTTDGYAEIEFEDALTLRLGTNSTVNFTELGLQNGGRVTRLTISQGTGIISAKLRRADAVAVAAANLNVNVPRDGHFRVDVSPTGSWVTVFHGKVQVDSGTGTATVLGGGHTLHQSPDGSGSPEMATSPAPDAFDKWVSHREDALNSSQSGTLNVMGNRGYTEGYADLYDYGLWSYFPGIGAAWVPYGMGAGWMPFMNGQWQFMDATGWNWVSAEPWGWVPYHFGSWVSVPGTGWAWLPAVGANSWMPATASWVQVNNQLGWIPNGPPQTSKPTKIQPAAATVILAAEGSSGTIRAGHPVSIARSGISIPASAPSPNFVAPAQPTAVMPRATGSLRAGTLVQSTSAGGVNAPRSLGAPKLLNTQSRLAGLSSVPPSLQAPHSLPAPAISRGASAGAFHADFNTPQGNGGAAGASSTTISQSAGASGRSSGGHR